MKVIKHWRVFESAKSVEDTCLKYGIRNWSLNPDGSIDVDGDVYLHSRSLKRLPLKFGRVTGYFDCSGNKLTNLEGSPNWVGDYFGCSSNNLTSLVGGPNFVGDDFDCSVNKLTSLEGCPEKIFGNLYCEWNKIISLDSYPTILSGQLSYTEGPIDEIWKNVIQHKPDNHGYYLTLFQLHDPIRFEGGQWVCYRECLDNFFEEIGVPSPPKLKNYREV